MLDLRERDARLVTLDHPRTSTWAAGCVIAAIRPWPQVLGERTLLDGPTRVVGDQGVGAASGHQHQRGPPGANGIRAPPPGCTRSCGPSVDCSPAISSRRFLAERILVPSDWPLLPWSGPPIAVKAFRPGQRPLPISANGHPLSATGRNCRCCPAQPGSAQSADER